MRKSGFFVFAASACLLGGAMAADPGLTGTTWLGDSCAVAFVFGADGSFGEYNEGGEDHFGQWQMDGSVLYLVFHDMSYIKAEVRNQAFVIGYPEGSDEKQDCKFTSSALPHRGRARLAASWA